MKLNLGCGQRREEGYVNVDMAETPAVDRLVNLFNYPWPWADESIEEIFASHLFEHVPGFMRFAFMDECYRILQSGGKAKFIVPYYSSVGAIQDPTHEWPPLCESSFLYFDKSWREKTNLGHYNVSCDFDCEFAFLAADGVDLKAMTEGQAKTLTKHNINIVDMLFVTMTRRER